MILVVGLLTKMSVTAQRFFGCSRHITDNTNFVFVAILQDERNILFKLNFCFYDTIAKQIVACNIQSIGNADNGV